MPPQTGPPGRAPSAGPWLLRVVGRWSTLPTDACGEAFVVIDVFVLDLAALPESPLSPPTDEPASSAFLTEDVEPAPGLSAPFGRGVLSQDDDGQWSVEGVQ